MRLSRSKGGCGEGFESHFRPEFLNRLDEIIMFKPLTKGNIGGIVDLLMADLNRRLKDQELSIELTKAAKDILLRADMTLYTAPVH